MHFQPVRWIDDTETTTMLACVQVLADAAAELLPWGPLGSPGDRRAAGGFKFICNKFEATLDLSVLFITQSHHTLTLNAGMCTTEFSYN